MTDKVKSWIEGGVMHIRFNNPAKHNALSVEMWEAIPKLLAQAEADDAVRMIVFSGEGGKSFISGADISQFEDQRAQKEAVKHYELMAEGALTGINEFSKPTVAAIQGYCVGGGVNVAIACDIRIATPESTFFVPATRLGLGYRFSALKNLVDLVGPGFAKHSPADSSIASRRRVGWTRCSRSTRNPSPPARRSPSRRASGSSRRS